jgi:alginate O-acetyltransferase complex protein AlgJ
MAAIRAGQEPGRSLPQCWDVFSFLRPKRSEVKAMLGAGSMGGLFAAGKATNNRILRDINQYEAALKERNALVQWLIPRMQSVVTGWLKGGNEDAYCGRGNWLFYRADLEYLTGHGFLEPKVLARRAASGNEWRAAPQPDPVAAIVGFRNQLQARGIDLVLVPAPVKPMICPDRFAARYSAAAPVLQNPSYGEFLRRMQCAGVKVFDPAPLLAEARKTAAAPLYLETDTHWTPEGMRVVASGLAQFIRERCPLPARAPVPYRLRPQTITSLGDIAGMLKLPDGQGAYRPQTVEIQQVLAADGQVWSAAAEADILFLGDSFANIFSFGAMKWGEGAGLVEHLSATLQRPLDSLVRNAGGSYATREALASQMRSGSKDRLAGKALVVWEFAARDLASGDWKLLDVTFNRAAAEQRPEAAPSGEVTVLAEVTAVSKAPPVNAPYAQALTYTQYAITRVEHGSLTLKSLVGVEWAMQQRRILEAGKRKPGDRLRLKLIPYGAQLKAHPEVEKIQAMNDIDDLEAELFWTLESSPQP